MNRTVLIVAGISSTLVTAIGCLVYATNVYKGA